MKAIITFLIMLSVAGAQHNHGDGDRKTVHGMLLFGTKKLYLSHLPIFGRNHDYQVIMEVELDKASKEKYLSSLKVLGTKEDEENPNKYHTVEPEAFLLPTKIKTDESFDAHIFRGHFERENSTDIAPTASFTIKKVIHFRKFDKEAERDRFSRWILFGEKEELHLAHFISQRPDFDQIFSVSISKGDLKKLPNFQNGIELVSELPNAPVVPGDMKDGLRLSADGNETLVRNLSETYLEVGDLQ